MNTQDFNHLNVKTDNYFTTFEYSELFQDLFSSVRAKYSKFKPLDNSKITTEKAETILKEVRELEKNLTIGVVILNTQEKADNLILKLEGLLKQID